MSAAKFGGFVRIRATPQSSDFPIVTDADAAIEVQQTDGTWMPLRGVVSVDVHITAKAIITATLEMEVGEIDLLTAGFTLAPESAEAVE